MHAKGFDRERRNGSCSCMNEKHSKLCHEDVKMTKRVDELPLIWLLFFSNFFYPSSFGIFFSGLEKKKKTSCPYRYRVHSLLTFAVVLSDCFNHSVLAALEIACISLGFVHPQHILFSGRKPSRISFIAFGLVTVKFCNDD